MRELIIAGCVLTSAGCETYEYPPRLRGVGTDDCPECEELVLSETRVPRGEPAISARFAFEDDLGAIDAVWIYVTTPSGEVLQESYVVERERVCDDDETPPCLEDVTLFRDGFTCTFASDESESVGPSVCELTAERFNAAGSTIADRLSGYERGVLIATFGVSLDEFGEWTVEVEARREGSERTNRLSTTFEAVPDVDDVPEE